MAPPSAIAKPIDVGNGLVCASFDPSSAAWLSLGRPHPRVGFVELSGLPSFDERSRGNPAATRAYRIAMTDGRHAFLAVEIDGRRPTLLPDVTDASRPRWRSPDGRLAVEVTVDRGGLTQRWRVDTGRVSIHLHGRLDRPALAEITETDPPSPTGAVTTMKPDGAVARLRADPLGATASIRVSGPAGWHRAADGLVASASGLIHLELRASLEVDGTVAEGDEQSTSIDGDRLVGRGLTYVRGCTALRVEPDERVILTDHRILPLSWTRDAYWQALGLLAADGPGDRERVADHLRWLWRRCERPDGRWLRSHHADGRRKDRAFQADQQLYPFVELADHWRATGAFPTGVAWEDEVRRAWKAVEREIHPATGLVATTESAADDPVSVPFVASSQILLWYAARRLAELAAAEPIGVEAVALDHVAVLVHTAFNRHFAARSSPWPYAVDGRGARIGYHDANDLPVALAPLWGFCRADDPGWRATMAFAFSAANPGWFAGRRAGLGSAHTPGPWTLGDIQGWIAGHTVGDLPAVDAARQRLEEVAFVDAMLPEAYGADDDGLRIRHWFAWPGAAIGALLMLERDGRLEEALGAERR